MSKTKKHLEDEQNKMVKERGMEMTEVKDNQILMRIQQESKVQQSVKNRDHINKQEAKEYFTTNLEKKVECVEGDSVDMLCEFSKPDLTAIWEKDGVVLQQSAKYQMVDDGTTHKLTIQDACLLDAGNYSVKINKRVSSTSLQVKDFIEYILEQKTKWTNKILRNWKIIKKRVNVTRLMDALSKYNLISKLHIRDLRAIDKSLAIDLLLIKSIGSITNEKTFLEFSNAISEASVNPDEIEWDAQVTEISADGITENILDNLQRSKSALKNILKEKHIIKIKDDFIEQLIFSLEDEERINDSLINGSKPTVFIETVFERIDKGSLKCLMMGLRNLQDESPPIQRFLKKLEPTQILSEGPNKVICQRGKCNINNTSETPVETYKIKLEVKDNDTEMKLESQLKKGVLYNTSVIYESLASQIEKTSPGCLEIYLRSVDGNIRKRLSASINDDTLLNIVSKIMNDDEMRKSLPPGYIYKLEARIVTFNQPGHLLSTHSYKDKLKTMQDNVIDANRSFLKRQLDTETVCKALLTKEIGKEILTSIENVMKDGSNCEKQTDLFLDILQKEQLEEMFLEVLKEEDMSYIYNRLDKFKRVYSADFSSLRSNLNKNFIELLKVDVDDVKDVFVERNMFKSLFERIGEDFEERPDQGMATLLIEIIKSGPVAMLTLVDALYICKMNELADLLLEQSENVQGLNPEELAVSSNSSDWTEELLFEGDYDIIVTKPEKITNSEFDESVLRAIPVLTQFQSSALEHTTSLTKGPDEAKLKEILDRTGYSLDVTAGQRKYGGPPPNMDDSSHPGAGHEVFCGKIPKDVFEDELIPLFEKFGQIWDLRLMMDPVTGFNRGYSFITYCHKEGANEAVKQLDSYEIKSGKHLKVNISVANQRLFIGNISKSKSKEEIMEEFSKKTDGLQDVIVYRSADKENQKNRGFAFLEYDSHKSASKAKRKLSSGRSKEWNCDVLVDWADPIEEPDSTTMSKVKVLFIRIFSSDVTEDTLKKKFAEFGEIERVKKINDYCFVHYKERDDAVKALDAMNKQKLGNLEIEVSLAKPPTENKKKLKEQRRRDQERRQIMMILRGRNFGGNDDFYGPPVPPGKRMFPGMRRQMSPPIYNYYDDIFLEDYYYHGSCYAPQMSRGRGGRRTPSSRRSRGRAPLPDELERCSSRICSESFKKHCKSWPQHREKVEIYNNNVTTVCHRRQKESPKKFQHALN